MPPAGKNPPRSPRGRPHKAGEARRRGVGPTRSRMLAIRVLERVVRSKAFADITLHHLLSGSDLSTEDRALATELVYGTLRWQGRLDFILSHVLDRDKESLEPLVLSTLRMGAYQILFSDRIADATAVDQAVHCIRALGAERACGLVNASLRRVSSGHASIPFPSAVRDPLGHLVHGLSLPEWIAKRWLDLYGPEDAAALARISNDPPPLSIRVNRRKNTASELLEEIGARFPDARLGTYGRDTIILGQRGNAAKDEAFLQGRFTIQDEASQLVVDFLDPQPGERVLDTCAAPGTKTTAIAERIGESGFVLAIDRHPPRLGLVARAARRLDLETIETLARDATGPLTDLTESRTKEGFDRVLVDAPCSGLGTLRRHPDARWRVLPEDIETLQALQVSILRQAAGALRVGGTLVYSTCTLVPEENEDVVALWLDQNNKFRRASPSQLPSSLKALLDESGDLRCLPHRHHTDGFYAARLERIP